MTGASVSLPYEAEQVWVTNNAGFKFHNWYGFGAVNVFAAVSMAKKYSGTLGNFANTGWILPSATPNSLIPDNDANGVSVPVIVTSIGTSNIVEVVQLKVTTTNSVGGNTGDIAIELRSPKGTKSILKTIKDGFTGTYFAGMVLASNAFYGESGIGTWTVKLMDGRAGGTQTLTDIQIRVYGH